MERTGDIFRKTDETEINIRLNIDGEGIYEIETGIGFFNHMLSLFAKHGQMNLLIRAKGDLEVDPHHTVEDIGIALGNAFKNSLNDKVGIKRYASNYLPMDEALAFTAVDISGRPYLVFDGNFTTDRLGDFDTELVEDFFMAFSQNAGITLHARIMYGRNNHHMIEALFKSLGRALNEASRIDPKIKGVMSTKGCL